MIFHHPRDTRSHRPVWISTMLVVLAGALALATPAAFAEVTHRYESQITEAGVPLAPFSEPWGMVFDSTGKLFVADAGGESVDMFDPANAFVPPQLVSSAFKAPFTRSVAISATTGDLYVAESGPEDVDVFKPEGANRYGLLEEDQFAGFVYVAVDNHPVEPSDPRAGDVYVLARDVGAIRLWAITPTADGKLEGPCPSSRCEEVPAPLGGFTNGPQPQDNSGLAVDAATGDVYVANPENHVVDVFNDKGEEQPLLAITGAGTPAGAGSFIPTAVAVDDADEVIYVVDAANAVVDEFSKTGAWLAQIKQTTPGQALEDPLAVAVQEHAGATKGEVYVSDGAAKAVDVFAAATVVLAGVTSGTASGVTATAATLSGTVNPAEVPVSACRFEYRTSAEPTFAHSQSCSSSPGSGNAAVPVSAALSGLTPNTTYHYLLVATNANGDSYGAERTFTTPGGPQVRGEVAEVDSTEKAGQTHAMLQGQINPDGRETTYHFEYGETTSYGTSVPTPDGTLGSGEAFVPVPAVELSGLKVGTTYHYRLVASNEYGQSVGPDRQLTTVAAALVDGFVTDVAATSVTLHAQINPLGSETVYYLQYGTVNCTTSPSSCTAVPASPVGVGSGESEVEVAPLHLPGLTPATVYHYRVVAENGLGSVDGPDQTFTTQTPGAFALPDARQWQLVSPPDKRGGVLLGISQNVIQAAAGGGAISYLSNAPTEAGAQGYAADVQVLSTRGAADWSARDIAPPHQSATGAAIGVDEEYNLFSADLSAAVVQPFGKFSPQISPEASEQTPFLRMLGACVTSCYRPLVTGVTGFANVPPGTHFGEELYCEEENGVYPGVAGVCGPRILGASPDARHVVLRSAAPLVEGAPAGTFVGSDFFGSLYEWSAGRLKLISVLPKSGAPTLPKADLTLGAENSHLGSAISVDGSRVVWSEVVGNKGLYLSGTATGAAESVQLDTPEPGCGSCLGGAGRFQAASADGSRVVFTDTRRLTADSGAGGNLYECQIVKDAGGLKCDLTDLTPEGVSGEPADVQGDVLGAGEDGSSVYFVADGVLAHNSVDNGAGEEEAQVGQPNLYLSHEGITTFIATLSDEDATDWRAGSAQPARVSPNGQWLAFMSARSLAGYDNRDAASGQLDAEVYLYGAGAGRLACASCDPTGARPVGVRYNRLSSVGREGFGEGLLGGSGGEWQSSGWVAALLPLATQFGGGGKSAYQGRYLSNEGRLFFNGLGALVSQDVNGNWDVYEHEPAGVGSCSPTAAGFDARSGACLGLISSGTSGKESAFLDASESGGDVFFLTDAKLASQDVDSARDVYDAHECSTEVPCFPLPPPPAPACEGDACQSPVEAPNDPTPGSLTFNGAGNLAPAIVPKPAVKSKTAAHIKAEKLAKALKGCHGKRDRHRRLACEKQARKRYGATAKAKKSTDNTDRRAK